MCTSSSLALALLLMTPHTTSGDGWQATSRATAACTLPVVDAAGLSANALAQRCAASSTPLLIRRLLDTPRWRAAAAALGDRAALLERFGGEGVRLSVGSFLAEGPEARSPELDGEKLAFMRGEPAWAAAAAGTGEAAGSAREENPSTAAFRSALRRQVAAGEARPLVQLGEFVSALRDGAVPPDAYVFHNVSGSPDLMEALSPLHELWYEITLVHIDTQQRSGDGKPKSRAAKRAQKRRRKLSGTEYSDSGMGEMHALARLGVGGEGSGTPFHDHELALSLAFAGRKHWLIARPETELVPAGPSEILHRLLPSPKFQAAWGRLESAERAWSCTQQAGEVVFIPEHFLHATVNLEEGVAAAVQCDNTDPRTNLTVSTQANRHHPPLV